MDKINEDIDFGQWICPKSWDDITLEKYMEIEQYYLNTEGKVNIIDILHIICNKTKDEVNALPIVFVEKILEQIAFIQEQPQVEPSNKVDINGEAYIVHTDRELRTGEFVAADMAIKSDSHDYATLMAILCRKEGEEYDSKFENEILPDRIELFKKQPITKILPIITFFLQLYILSTAPSQLSSLIEEGLSLTQESIENSRRNGDLSMLSTWLLMRKLNKLKKSIRHI